MNSKISNKDPKLQSIHEFTNEVYIHLNVGGVKRLKIGSGKESGT